MIDLTTPIIPYVGTGIFKPDASYNEVKTLLAEQNISYKEKILEETDVDPPWTVIGISKAGEEFDAISITFAKNRLFKICLYKDFDGNLAERNLLVYRRGLEQKFFRADCGIGEPVPNSKAHV